MVGEVNGLQEKEELTAEEQPVEEMTETEDTPADVTVEDVPAEEDKAARREAMQKALKEATKSPYGMMEDILAALKTTQKAVGKSNTNAASDLGVAALNLKAGLQGAWLNVLINLSGVKDEAFVVDYRSKGEELLQKGCALADEIYQEILKVV